MPGRTKGQVAEAIVNDDSELENREGQAVSGGIDRRQGKTVATRWAEQSRVRHLHQEWRGIRLKRSSVLLREAAGRGFQVNRIGLSGRDSPDSQGRRVFPRRDPQLFGDLKHRQRRSRDDPYRNTGPSAPEVFVGHHRNDELRSGTESQGGPGGGDETREPDPDGISRCWSWRGRRGRCGWLGWRRRWEPAPRFVCTSGNDEQHRCKPGPGPAGFHGRAVVRSGLGWTTMSGANVVSPRTTSSQRCSCWKSRELSTNSRSSWALRL